MINLLLLLHFAPGGRNKGCSQSNEGRVEGLDAGAGCTSKFAAVGTIWRKSKRKEAVDSTDATLVQQALEHVPKLLRLDKLSKQSKSLTLLHEIGFDKVGTRINGLGTIGINEGRCLVK